MATKRWRKGSVETITTRGMKEYRVGPVPDESGIVGHQKHYKKSVYGPLNYTTRAIEFDVSKHVLPDFQDLWNAVSKIKSARVNLAAYVKKNSQPGFRWVGGTSMPTSEVRRQLYNIMTGRTPVTDITDFMNRILPIPYPVKYVTAVNFLEV